MTGQFAGKRHKWFAEGVFWARWFCMNALLLTGGALLVGAVTPAVATTRTEQRLTIAAASDLRFALPELMQQFALQQGLSASDVAQVVFGSSGKLSRQIAQGAPFDVFFSADEKYTNSLYTDGKIDAPGIVYARGRLVLWSRTRQVQGGELSLLKGPEFRHIALAQPAHAPYGVRAQQALQYAGIWSELEPRFVFAENVAQTAQLAQSGAADAAFIALSLALHPSMRQMPGANYQILSESWHQPLRQTMIVTRTGAGKKLAAMLIQYLQSQQAQLVLQRYGFVTTDISHPGIATPQGTP